MGRGDRAAVIPRDERAARSSPAGVTRRAQGAKMLRAVESSFVTIMFTDVVGSTTLYDRFGDDEADARRARHFAVLREVVASHDGREVKSTGDGLMVTFTSAVAAV